MVQSLLVPCTETLHPPHLVRSVAECRDIVCLTLVRVTLRDAPYAEEAEYVVDPYRIEVALHHRKAVTPPAEVLRCHRLPVVGGEAPVLPIGGEEVGRCASLFIQVEEVRSDPYIDAISPHADRQVALDQDVMPVRGLRQPAQLVVQEALDKGVPKHLPLRLCSLDGPRSEVLLPDRFVVRIIGDRSPRLSISKDAKETVSKQILPLTGHKFPHPLHRLIISPIVAVVDHLTLELPDGYVVDLRQGVELGSSLLPAPPEGCLFVSGESTHIEVKGIKPVGGDGVVGIGVERGTCKSGVVEGEHLVEMLSQLGKVANEVHRISKVADTVGPLRAQGKEWCHRPLDTPSLPCGLKFRLVDKGEREGASLLRSVDSIGSLLPEYRPVP